MMFDLSLRESAGSCSLDRLVRLPSVLDGALPGGSEAESPEKREGTSSP